MTHHKVTQAVLLASLIAVAMPAQAAGPRLDFSDTIFGDRQDDACLTLEKVKSVLQRKNFTDIVRSSENDTNTSYAFYAIGLKPDGEKAVWYLVYDACERELVVKQDES